MQTEHRIGGMKEPQTYQELADWFKEYPDEAQEWVSEHRHKYIDLRIAKLKDYPRDLFKKQKKENSADWQYFISTSTQSLFEDDRVDEHHYYGDLEAARYWDAFCGHFKITRSDLYAARVREKKAFLEETLEDDDSTLEDIQEAWAQVKLARKDYHDARNYKILLKKHKNAALAKALYDHWIEETFKELADDEVIDMEALRPKIINYVMLCMQSANKSRKPTRPTVDRWLKGYRDQPIEGYPPERQAYALEAAEKHEVQKPK